ncbi:hypothetical protein VB779_09550 [Haloarculaceae archaeon H-GB11]|nr:hypothetical protein [Haloarculaceae archaeon H-GB11]
MTSEVEAVVADDSLPTVEVSKSISPSLGQIAHFEREDTARQVAATLSQTVLDEDNWVDAEQPTNPGAFRQND